MILSISVLIYVFSLAYNYWWTKTAFSKGGIFYPQNISFGYFFWCICPIANSVATSVNLFHSPREHASQWFDKFLNKLFRIKK